MGFKERLYIIYAYIFAKKYFIKFNLFLYHLSLRGLGILNWQNEYLSGEKAWLTNFLKHKNSPLIIDIGAHIGKYTNNVYKANINSKVVAFEPHPKTYKMLLKNINEDTFQSYNFAVGDREKIIKLYDYKDIDGSQHASIYEDVIKVLHKGEAVSHEIKVIKLDDYFDERIDLLKIDTEGNELKVLYGAEQLIKNHKIEAIHFEFNEMNIISKSTFKDFWDLLKDYDFFRMLPGGEIYRIHLEYYPLESEIYAYQNIVALLKREFK